MIVFDNVTKYYKSNVGLEKVSVRINKGDFVFLVGPSGAGKSTFIKLILKEIEPLADRVEVTPLGNIVAFKPCRIVRSRSCGEISGSCSRISVFCRRRPFMRTLPLRWKSFISRRS